jgi:hypothetical protein
VLDVRLIGLPEHTGVLLFAVGVAGVGLITTLTVPAAEVQPFIFAVTEYVPDAAVVTPVIVGFCVVLVKLLGPDHV